MSTSSEPIQFFDIASAPPKRTYAPNPWKTRYALNLKSIPYYTEWIELPDVKATRLAHAVAPIRKHADNTDFHTLPMIHDPATNTYIGDSFDIAVYLDTQYPDRGPRLFAPGSIPLHRVFNAHIDALFSRYIALAMQGLPFNPDTAAQSQAEFARRAGVASWEELRVEGAARTQLLERFRAELDALAKLLWAAEEEEEEGAGGPFVAGATPGYGDLVVGGWLGILSVALPEWEDVCTWQGGRWGRLHEGLAPWAVIR